MSRFFLASCISTLALSLFAQADARLFRYPDVSDTRIAFVYGGDIWLVPKTGGTAFKITSSPGEESFPRFSPDGNTIGFSANYNGNVDIYTMSLNGGSPQRLTYNSFTDRMVDWHPDGKQVLFVSRKESGVQAYGQFYLVSDNGGLPQKLSIPYGELGSFSQDGSKLAYVTRITENYPFKRYRGGLASDVVIYDLAKNTAENVTNNAATDGKPAWHQNKIYYVSDIGDSKRRNIWVYHTDTKRREQVTFFSDFDINHMSLGPSDIVFEAGGSLYLLSTATHNHAKVNINIIADVASIMSRTVKVNSMINAMDASPDGKRIVMEARGEIFSLPAEHGYIQNLTNTSGAFDRIPAWSPDGKYIAYWSDRDGEYQIYLLSTDGKSPEKQLTHFTSGFGFRLFWSPDSKKLAFVDYMQNINILDIATGQNTVADRTNGLVYNQLAGFLISWSPDNSWLAYSKTLDNLNEALFLYNLNTKSSSQMTAGFYNDYYPVFDPEGKYLYFYTDRSLSPVYSNLDATWIYPNATQIAAVSLLAKTKSLLYVRNDTVAVKEEKEEDPSTSSGPVTETKELEKKGKADKKDKTDSESEKDETKKDTLNVEIDLAGFESRLVILPVKAGNFGELNAVKGKIIYQRYPNSGSGGSDSPLLYYDLEKREEKTIMGNVGGYKVTADEASILVSDNNRFGIISVGADQKLEKTLRTDEMTMSLNPREEWHQIFNDTWRRYRDFFYDPAMQQVDWNAMKNQYGSLIDHAITRWDVTNIIIELISDLSAGHTYAWGGAADQTEPKPTGFLGIDWTLDQGKYKIKRIVRPAPWDNEVRAPFDRPGVDVQEGDFILSVNGREVNPALDPYAAFEGLSGKTISLLISKSASGADPKEVIVDALSIGQETRLRHLEWIDTNRKTVETLSNGQLAYIYVPNTGEDGQTELLRMFYGQLDKKGFIIDERFNGGGQLTDRFLEMLNRSAIYYIGWRNGRDMAWPTKANDGPKTMLINGWAGSGGDAFPWGFKQLNLGPIIGERTLGILVGPATGHQLIDNGGITVPDARLYGPDGKWFAEGHGVEPTIEVWDDPAELAKGNDPQLKRAIDETMKLIQTKPRKVQKRPAYEDRSANGIRD